ncbi:CMGC SRPK protein kinase, partial [Aspergillus sclerotialis]
SLKILTAEASSRRYSELEILRVLVNSLPKYPGHQYVISVLDYFQIRGPNGSHLCLVSELAGPSVTQMSLAPGQDAGARRLRGDIARRFARQMTEAVAFLHAAGIVHGDISASNILIKLLRSVHFWNEQQIHQNLGRPIKDEVITSSNEPLESSAPHYLVEPANLTNSELLSDEILLNRLRPIIP